MLEKLEKFDESVINSLLQHYKFYTQECTQEVSIHYTDRITGDLDLARFKDNDILCWREPAVAKALKPKKIIITDLISRFRLFFFHNDNVLTSLELFFLGFSSKKWIQNLRLDRNA